MLQCERINGFVHVTLGGTETRFTAHRIIKQFRRKN